jgi:hypothetical protein
VVVSDDPSDQVVVVRLPSDVGVVVDVDVDVDVDVCASAGTIPTTVPIKNRAVSDFMRPSESYGKRQVPLLRGEVDCR